MPLILDDNYRVVTDSGKLNAILQEYREVTNKKTKETSMQWVDKGYFGDLQSLLKRYLKEIIMDNIKHDNTDIHKLIQIIEQTEKNIIKTIEEKSDVLKIENIGGGKVDTIK